MVRGYVQLMCSVSTTRRHRSHSPTPNAPSPMLPVAWAEIVRPILYFSFLLYFTFTISVNFIACNFKVRLQYYHFLATLLISPCKKTLFSFWIIPEPPVWSPRICPNPHILHS